MATRFSLSLSLSLSLLNLFFSLLLFTRSHLPSPSLLFTFIFLHLHPQVHLRFAGGALGERGQPVTGDAAVRGRALVVRRGAVPRAACSGAPVGAAVPRAAHRAPHERPAPIESLGLEAHDGQHGRALATCARL